MKPLTNKSNWLTILISFFLTFIVSIILFLPFEDIIISIIPLLAAPLPLMIGLKIKNSDFMHVSTLCVWVVLINILSVCIIPLCYAITGDLDLLFLIIWEEVIIASTSSALIGLGLYIINCSIFKNNLSVIIAYLIEFPLIVALIAMLSIYCTAVFPVYVYLIIGVAILTLSLIIKHKTKCK